MAATYSYNSTEKLKSRKLLDRLFTEGKSFSVFPVKVFFMPLAPPVDHPVKAGVGVSARNFRKAVDRNRIKRLLRECYRLNKLPLHAMVAAKGIPVAVFFLYIGKEMPDHILLNEKMQKAIAKFETSLT
ncbi:MAG: ribonuclease protein component [Sediminibacterium sp.]|nr:ribonuclease protein component [Sediminibacterium sp.]